MDTYRVTVTISENGSLALKGLPFTPGEKVEVILRRQKRKSQSALRYPLSGTPFRYTDPFDGVATDDWESLQ